MKKIGLQFIFRGLVAGSIGPIVLAILYLILHHKAGLDTLTVNEVCIGIFSLSALAFIAGGMNVIYQIERLPLMVAILIHGSVLYVCYLCTYLINGWLQLGITPFLVFTGVFVFGYFVIWTIIYSIIKRKTAKLNEILKTKQETTKINMDI